MDKTLIKLRRIQELWVKLEHMSPRSSEYASLMKEIQTFASEYKTLVESTKKPKESK